MKSSRKEKYDGVNIVHRILSLLVIIENLGHEVYAQSKHNLTIGIIYDDTFDYQRWDLLELFKQHVDSLEHAICSDVSYVVCEASAKMDFVAGKYSAHEVCRQINMGARIILSVTTCDVAFAIEQQCRIYDIPHLAVPKPHCKMNQILGVYDNQNLQLKWGLNSLPWFAVDLRLLIIGLHHVSKMDQTFNAIVLSDGSGELPLAYALKETLYLITGNGNVKCSTHQFNLGPMESRLRLRPIDASIHLKDLLNPHNQQNRIWYKYSMNHVYIFSELYDPVEQLKVIMNSNITQNEVYWVFVETTDVVPVDLLQVLHTYPNVQQNDKPNVALIRQYPLDYTRQIKVSSDHFEDQTLYKTNVNMMMRWPERILLLGHLAFFSGKAFAFANIINSSLITDQKIVCMQNKSEKYAVGSILRDKIFQYIKRSSLNSHLWFYATQTSTTTGQTKFVPTAKVDVVQGNLTLEGETILKETKVSGLFPNRFRGLDNRLLKIGTVVDVPLIASANVTSDGQLINATGIVVDILDTLAKRFNFRYILLTPDDGQYGEKRPNGTWTGLIGDLVSNRIDIAASMLTLTQDRAYVINLLGPFLLTSNGMMMAKMTVDQYPFKMLKPFRSHVWTSILVSVLLAGFAMYLLNRCSPFSAWNLALPGASSDEVSLRENMWSIIGNYVNQGSEFYPIAVSARTAQLLIWLFVLIIMSTWQADMTAFMTRSYVRPTISSLRDLANQNKIKPIMLSGSSVIDVFKNKGDAVYKKIYKLLVENTVNVQTTKEGYDMVKADPNLVFIHDSILLQYLAQQDCESVQMIPEVFDEQIAGFAVLPGHSFEAPFSRFLSQAFESGVIRRIFDKWLFSVKLCKQNEADYRPMKLHDVLGAFIILCSCILLSIVVLTGENVWKRLIGSICRKYWSSFKQWFLLHMMRIKPENLDSTLKQQSTRRFSEVSVDELPESVAREFRYAGRRRSTCAYNASSANFKNPERKLILHQYLDVVKNRIGEIRKREDNPVEETS